jgi:cysteine desulfurase / selenocysteine lyase
MQNVEQLQGFWNSEIRPRFDESAIGYSVVLADGTRTRYANLDNATTTTPFLKVTRGLEAELWEYGSIRRGAGRKAKVSTARYEQAKTTIHRFLNAGDDHYVVLTANTTSAVNQLAYFFARIKGTIMVSDIEHSSNIVPWIFQEGWRRVGDQVTLEAALSGQTHDLNRRVLDLGRKRVITYRTARDFTLDLADVERILRAQNAGGEEERVKALVVTGASNATGYRPPLRDMARIAHRYGAMIVVDGCQLLQHERVDMCEQNLDFVVFSGHKMYAPFGSGVIVGDRRLLDAFWPYQMGGGNFLYLTGQGEVLMSATGSAHDPGTPNYPGARALHHAINELDDIGIDHIAAYERGLVQQARTQLEDVPGLQLAVPKDAPQVFERSLITFNISGLPHHLVAEVLDWEYGIGTRAGTYCVYEFARRVAGITQAQDERIAQEVRAGTTAGIPGSVRASFCLYNNLEDVERLVEAIRRIAGEDPERLMSRYRMNERTGEWSHREGPRPCTPAAEAPRPLVESAVAQG